MLIGGATIPKIAPNATIAPTFALGIPIFNIIGATIVPQLIIAANDEPVIIPGSIKITINESNNAVGNFLKALTSKALT